NTESITHTLSTEFSESLTTSINNSISNTLSLSASDLPGEYRYIQLATFDVYVVLVCDLDQKKCYYEYLTSVKKDSISAAWYYGKTREEMMIPEELDSTAKKLSFDTSALSELDMYTPVTETRLVRKIRAYSNEDYYVSYWKGTTYYVWMKDCSPIYNSEAVKGLGLENVRITVNYTVESRDGESKCVAKLYSNTETLLNKSKNVDGTKDLTMEITMTHDKFLQTFLTDKKIYTSFEADKSSYFDYVDNHYHITFWELIVELY
ncbi:MAG: hypothetical protein IJW46_01440, partial [Clostridia bacterium]|nr:hypothetical protein [Clostridia bacterium]